MSVAMSVFQAVEEIAHSMRSGDLKRAGTDNGSLARLIALLALQQEAATELKSGEINEAKRLLVEAKPLTQELGYIKGQRRCRPVRRRAHRLARLEQPLPRRCP